MIETGGGAAIRMTALSAVTIALAVTLHRVSEYGPGHLISYELAALNPLAWLLLVCLVAVATILVRQLAARRHVVRTMLLTLAIPCLITISVTAPQKPAHVAAFVALVVGTGAWFLLIAVELGKPSLLAASALAAIVLPVLGMYTPGIAQKLFVIYGVIAANVVFHNIDDLDAPGQW